LVFVNLRMNYLEEKQFPIDIFVKGDYIIVDFRKTDRQDIIRGEIRAFFKHFKVTLCSHQFWIKLNEKM